MSRKAERFLLILGISLSGVFLSAEFDSFFFARFALWESNTANGDRSHEKVSGVNNVPESQIDFSVWARSVSKLTGRHSLYSAIDQSELYQSRGYT